MVQSLLVGLEESERTAITNYPLSVREKMLLNHYLSGGTKDTLDELCNRENISRSYLYKLERSLLAKIYESILSSGTDVLELLFERRLYPNFLHYCKYYEHLLLKEDADKKTLNSFYKTCFDYFVHFQQVENIDLKLIQEYGLKYGKTLERPIPDHRLQISAVLLGLQLVLINSEKRLTLDKKMSRAEKLLEKNQLRYYRTQNIKAKYYYYIARSRYYSSYRQDKLETLMNVLRKAEQIITMYPEKFTEVERIDFSLRMGRVYLIYNQHQKSYDVYNSIYQYAVNWKQYGIPNFFGYVRALIQVGKYDKAYKMLEQASDAVVNSGTKIFEVALYLLFAEVMLHMGKYEFSLYQLQRAKTVMQGKVYYHNYDISLRVTETTIAFLMCRWDVADELISRNLKWFKDNKEDSKNPSVVYLRFLRILLEKKFSGKTIPKRYLSYMQNERSPLRAFPLSILEQLVAHVR